MAKKSLSEIVGNAKTKVPTNENNTSPGVRSLSEIVKKPNPDYNFGSATEAYGFERGTDLEKYTPYNVTLYPSIDIDTERARNQSGWEQAGNAIVGGLFQGVLSAVEGLSYLPSVVNWAVTGDDFERNFIAEAMVQGKESLREYFPIYRTNANKVFDWEDSGFYFDTLRSIIDSVVGFGVPGGVIAKGVGLAGKAISVGAKTNQVLKFLSQSEKFNKFAQLAGTAYATNHIETMVMATELYDNLLKSDEFKQAIDSGKWTLEEAKKQAGDKAFTFSLLNRGMMLTNAAQLKSMYAFTGRGRGELTKVGFKQFALDQLKTAPSEALEEGYQSIIQGIQEQYGKDAATGAKSKHWTDLAIELAQKPETQLEALMGLVSGPFQYGLTKAPFELATRKARLEHRSKQDQALEQSKQFIEKKSKDVLSVLTEAEELEKEGKFNEANTLVTSAIDQMIFDNIEVGTLNYLEKELEQQGENEFTNKIKERIQVVEDAFKRNRKYINGDEIASLELTLESLKKNQAASKSKVKEFNESLLSELQADTQVTVQDGDAIRTRPLDVQLEGNEELNILDRFEDIQTGLFELENISTQFEERKAKEDTNLNESVRKLQKEINEMKTPEYQKNLVKKQEREKEILKTIDDVDKVTSMKELDSFRGDKNKDVQEAIQAKEQELIEKAEAVINENKDTPDDTKEDPTLVEEPETPDIDVSKEQAELDKLNREEEARIAQEEDTVKLSEVLGDEETKTEQSPLDKLKSSFDNKENTSKKEPESQSIPKKPKEKTEEEITKEAIEETVDSQNRAEREFVEPVDAVSVNAYNKRIGGSKGKMKFAANEDSTHDTNIGKQFLNPDVEMEGKEVYLEWEEDAEPKYQVSKRKEESRLVQKEVNDRIEVKKADIERRRQEELNKIENAVNDKRFATTDAHKKHWQKELFFNKLKQLKDALSKPIKSGKDIEVLTKLLNDVRAALNSGIADKNSDLQIELEESFRQIADDLLKTIPSEIINEYIQLFNKKIVTRGLSVEKDLLQSTDGSVTMDGKNEEYFLTKKSVENKNNAKYDAELAALKAPSETKEVTKPVINIYWGSPESSTNTKVLSNLAPRKFTYEGKEYGSVEHAYQTLKSGSFDQATYDKYVKAGGYGTKIRGKAVQKGFDNLQLMKDLVVESFKQNPDQAALLLNYSDFTHTTNEVIDKAFLDGIRLAQKNAELAALEPTQQTSNVEAEDGLEKKNTSLDNPLFIDSAPVVIKDADGNIIARLSTTEKGKPEEASTLRKIREYIRDNGTFKTRINGIKPGLLLFSKTNRTVKEALDGDNVFVGYFNGKTNSVEFGKQEAFGKPIKKEQISNGEILSNANEGHQYAVVRTGKNEYVALPLFSERINQDIINNLLRGIKAWLTEDQAIIDEVQVKSGIDLSTKEGLSDFISLFIHDTHLSSEKMLDADKDLPEGKLIFGTGPNNLSFGFKGMRKYFLAKTTGDKAKQDIFNTLKNLLTIENAPYFGMSSSVEGISYIPMINPDGSVTNLNEGNSTYMDFVKSNVYTNVVGVKDEDSGNVQVKLNKFFYIDTSSLNEGESPFIEDDPTEVKEDASQVKINNEPKIGDTVTLQTKTGGDGVIEQDRGKAWLVRLPDGKGRQVKKENVKLKQNGKKKTKEGGQKVLTPEQQARIDKIKNKQSTLKKKELKDKAEGKNTDEQLDFDNENLLEEEIENQVLDGAETQHVVRELSETIAFEIVKELTSVSEVPFSAYINKKKQQLEEQKATLEEDLEFLKEIEDTEGIELFEAELWAINQVLDNWNNVKENTLRKLKQIALVKGEDVASDEDGQSSFERELHSDTFNLTLDSKSTISRQLKQFFASIESGEDTLFDTPKLMNFDEVYNTLHKILVDVYPNMDAAKKRLQEYVTDNPKLKWINNVIEKLDKAPTNIQNQFLTDMAKHKVNMNFAVYNVSKGSYTVRILNDNSSDDAIVLYQMWQNNFIESPLLTEDSQVNPDILDRVKQDLKALRDYKSDDEESRELLGGILKVFGVVLRDDSFDYLDKYGIRNTRGEYVVQKYIVDSLNNIVRDLEKKSFNLKTYTALEDGIWRDLAEIDSIFSIRMFSNSFRVGDKTIYSYTNNKYVNIRTKELTGYYNEDGDYVAPQLVHDLRKDIIAKDNYLLQELYDGTFMEDPTMMKFGYVSLNPFKSLKSKSNKTEELRRKSDGEHELIQTMFFQSNSAVRKQPYYLKKGDTTSARFRRRKTTFFFPTFSDKSVMNTLDYMGFLSEFKPKSTTLADKFIALVYVNAVEPEVDRIRNKEAIKNAANLDLSNDSKIENDAYELFYMLPELNDLEINGETYLNHVKLGTHNTKEVKQAVYKAIRNRINSEADAKLKVWEENQIGTSDKKSKNKFLDKNYLELFGGDKRKAAIDMTLNYMLFNSFVFSTYTGDIAQYFKSKSTDKKIQVEETLINLGKRLAGDTAPGNELAADKNASYTHVFFTDQKRNLNPKIRKIYSQFLTKEQLAEYIGKNGKGKIDHTDAQEYVTWQEHLRFLEELGKISKERKAEITKAIKSNEKLTKDMVKDIFQPIKPVFVDNIEVKVNDNFNYQKRVYIKTAAIPLVPQFTTGKEIDNLRVALEKIQSNTGSTVRASFKSAVKVGFPKGATGIFEGDNNERIKNPDVIAKEAITMTLNRKGLRNQQDNPSKTKSQIIDGTQQRKLLFSNTLGVGGFKFNGEKPKTGLELQDTFYSTYHDIFKDNLRLLDKTTRDSNGRVNLTKVQSLIEDEAIARGYSENEIKMMKLVERDGKLQFAYPLEYNPQSLKIQSLLVSVVNNKLLKLKNAGYSYVLASDAGFIFKDMESVTDFTDEIIYSESWDGKELLPQRVEDGVVKGAQVLIQPRYRTQNGLVDLTKYATRGENGKLTLDTSKLPKDFLSAFGYRIPTQGMNSMSYIEIVGFLPEHAGDIIVAPKEFTVQMGSDFDVDKLYVNFKELYEENGKLKNYDSTTDLNTKAKEIVDNKENYLKILKELKQHKKLSKNFTAYADGFWDIIVDNYESEIDLSTEGNVFNILSDLLTNSKQIDKLEKYIKNFDAEDYILRKRVKVNQNKLLDVHYSVLSNPAKEVQSQIIAPLGFGKLHKTADDVFRASINKDLPSSPLSQNYQRDKYTSANAADIAIGRFALDNTFHFMLQRLKAQGNPLKVGRWDKKKGFIPTDLSFGNITSPAMEKGELGNDKTHDKSDFIGNVLSYFLSAAVDNEKEQILGKLNVNSDTFNAIKIMAYAGYDEEIIGKFIASPIVKEYTRRLALNSSKLSGYNPDVNPLEELIKELGFEGEISKLRNLNTITSKTPLRKLLTTLIEKNDYTDKEYAAHNLAILLQFDSFSKEGGKISSLQSILNTENKRLGKSLTDTQQKEQDIIDLNQFDLAKGTLNAINLVQNKDNEEVEIAGNVVQPEGLLGIYSYYGAFTANDLWKSSFPTLYSIPFKSDVMKELVKAVDTSNWGFTKKVETRQDLLEGYTKYQYGQYLASINTNYKERRIELLTGNNSLQDRLKQLKESDEESWNSNRFLSRLSFDKIQGIKRVNINAAPAVNMHEEDIILDFLSFFKTNRQLASDLIEYSLMIGGTQKAREFMKYIPAEIIEKLSFVSFENIPDAKKFIKEYFQHNPTSATLIPSEKVTIKNDKVYLDSEYLTEEGTPLFTFFYTSAGFDKNKLYMIQEDNSFIQIPLKGVQNISEYNSESILNLKVDKEEVDIGQTLMGEERVTYEENLAKLNSTFDLLSRGEPIDNPIENSTNYYKKLLKTSGNRKTIQSHLRDVGNKSDSEQRSKIANYLADYLDEFMPDLQYSLSNTNVVAGEEISRGRHRINDKRTLVNIYLNPKELDSAKKYEETLIHEVIHGVTSMYLYDPDMKNPKVKKLFSSYEKYKAYVAKKFNYTLDEFNNLTKDDIINIGKEDKTKSRELYSAFNIREFLSHTMSFEDSTIENLKSLKPDGSFFHELKQIIIDLVNEILGTKDNTALSESVANILFFMESNRGAYVSTTIDKMVENGEATEEHKDILSNIFNKMEDKKDDNLNFKVKPGVEELFDSNPELASQVYEALGFKKSNLELDFNINEANGINITAVSKNQVVGGIELQKRDNNYFVRTVGSSYENQGIATELYKEAIKYVTEKNGVLKPDKASAPQVLSIYKKLEKEGLFKIDSVSEQWEDGRYVIEGKSTGVLSKNDITPQQKQQALQLYSAYLDTIFPDSKVKDIVYHGSDTKLNIDSDFHGYVTYFTNNKGYAQNVGFKTRKRDKLYSVIINLKNPAFETNIGLADVPQEHAEYLYNTGEMLAPRWAKGSQQFKNNDGIVGIDKFQKEYPGYKEGDYTYVTFESEQIHTLGSKQDIEGFKKYTKSSKVDDSLDFDSETLYPNDNTVYYNMRAISILQSDKAEQVFEKGKKNADKFSISEINAYINKLIKEGIIEKNCN